jgi:hypothetical protein
MKVQRTMTVNVVFEAEEDDIDWTERYLGSSFTTAFPGLRKANVGLAIRNEAYEVDRELVIKKLGEPSPEMRKLMEFEFGPDEPDPVEVKTA